MIDPKYQKLIQIEITNGCPYQCCHCSRLIGHHRKPFFMDVGDVKKALQTLVEYPGHIGLMGGEPTVHVAFEEICKLYQKYVPVKARRELWTAGWKWKEYEKIIHETFYPELIAFNEHYDYQPCFHQPLQIAIEEVINNEELKQRIISNCWVQQRWSASITPWGAYFCEIAAARAHLFGEPKGIPIEKDWWKKPLKDYAHQIKALCNKCSACLPMPMKPNDKQEWDAVSPGMHKILMALDSPKCKKGNCKIYNLDELRRYYENHAFEPETDYLLRGGFKDFPDWRPWNYRDFKRHEPDAKS